MNEDISLRTGDNIQMPAYSGKENHCDLSNCRMLTTLPRK
jgi:hypothetical protein